MANKQPSPKTRAPLRIAVLGAGTVGGGVLRLLAQNRALIKERAGREIRPLAVAVKNRAKKRPPYFPPLADGWRQAVENPQADAVVELVGGQKTARAAVLRALDLGKPVVTANKALLAENGDDIFARAQKARVPILFEAAIAGCIPIVKALREALAADRVVEIAGIINGTSNFILSRMQNGDDFRSALALAQKLGFAEADPRLDVGGGDAAHKIALLARIAFGGAPFDQIAVGGIDGIDAADMTAAARLGYRVKMLAVARAVRNPAARGQALEIWAQPTLVPQSHSLAAVDGVTNAVVVRSQACGETAFHGAGAGAAPTAAAVVADLIDLARGRAIVDFESRPPPPVLPAAATRAPFYLRLQVIDRPGTLAKITQILAARKASIEAIWQAESAPARPVSIAILLHETERGIVEACLREARKIPAVVGAAKIFPIEKLR